MFKNSLQLKKYVKVWIPLWAAACLCNALMDAIEHSAPGDTAWVWHAVKVILFFPSLFFSGYFFALSIRENEIGNIKRVVVFSIVSGAFLWQVVYNALRFLFAKTGVPGWF